VKKSSKLTQITRAYGTRFKTQV